MTILQRLQRGPAEGWLTIGLVGLMALSLAWSIDDARWVLGREEWTDFLPWIALAGVAVGVIGAKVGWSLLVGHLVGAVFAALIVPLVVGGVLVPDGPWGVRYEAVAAATVGAFIDLIIEGLASTRQTGHHLVVLGMLVWATGQFAASAVFRHRRPLGAVLVVGALLIGNVSATPRYQLWFVVIFTLASLFLLIRLHALEEQSTWLRRRIGDPGTVGSLYLRGGTVFILITVFAALTLTATARSSPLAGAWEDVKPFLLEVSSALQRFLPAGIEGRSIGSVQFGPNATVQGVWTTDESLALTIQRPPGDDRPYYWRAVVYDQFTHTGWSWSAATATTMTGQSDLLGGTLDEVPAVGHAEVQFTITPESQRGPFAFSPLGPLTVDRESQLHTIGGANGYFGGFQVAGREPYTITARVPVLGDGTPGGLTQNRLRVAGQDYPESIRKLYLTVPAGAIGEDAQQLFDDIMARVPADNPWDIAVTIREELLSDRFRYDTDVRQNDCNDRSTVECFAHFREGYCQHYASTMAILLRHAGIPARWVQGYLPGDRDLVTGVETIYNTGAHAWVEAYFPGAGWVLFDPTGGDVAAAEAIPSGVPVPSPSTTPRPSVSIDPNALPRDDEEGSQRPGAVPPTRPDGGPGAGGFIIIAAVLLLVIAIVAFLAWRRGPRGEVTPESAFRGVGRLAGRFGFGPRPTQTAFEYAAALGDVLPNIRPELQTVANAKVEVAYGRRALGADRIRALADSYRRLRVALLRLAFRRRERPRRR